MKYVYDPEHSRPKHTSVSVSLCVYAVCLSVSLKVNENLFNQCCLCLISLIVIFFLAEGDKENSP